MSLRGLRKKMKPIVWLITLFFLISLVAGYVMSFRGGAQKTQYAFKLNGEKVAMYTVQRAMALAEAEYKQAYKGTAAQNLDSQILNTVTLNEFIDRMLLLDIEKKMKIGSTESQAKERIAAIEANFGGKDKFKQALLAQGYTERTLRKELEEGLTINELTRKVTSDEVVTDSEVEEFYNQNKYIYFKEESLNNEVKEQIIQRLKAVKAAKTLALELVKARKGMELTSVSKELKPYLLKIEFTYEGIDVTNVEYDERIIVTLSYLDSKSLDEAKTIAKKEIEKEIRFLKLLEQQQGIEVDASLPLELQMLFANEKAFDKLKSEINPTDKELEEYFDKNRSFYDIERAVEANIAVFGVMPSQKDIKLAEEKANKLLKEVNVENFAEYAKKYSNCPSASNGGALGAFKKGMMAKEFEEAAFSGEVGKIYPKVVKTQFGEHIIFVQSKDDKAGTVTASHILITPKPSDETLNMKSEEVATLVKELQSGKLTFGELRDKNPNIQFSQKDVKITEARGIFGLPGDNKKLIDRLFAAKLNQVSSIKDDGRFIIYQVLKQIPYKKAVLSQVEVQVIAAYKAEKATEKLQEMQQSVN